MDIRELKYFLAVAKEGNISKAAEYLYITQPSLSRQIQGIEEEIGRALFIRGSRKMTLTETGVLLRKRAEEIVALYEKTEAEIINPSAEISGEIHIAGGESYAIETIAQTAKELHDANPNILFHFYSADTNDVIEKLDKGLVDFGILIEPADLTKYEFIRLPLSDVWGVLMRKDNPLSNKEFITQTDLANAPILRSRHSLGSNPITNWFGKDADKLNIVATYNLIYNASLLVKTGLGCAICLDKLVNTDENSELCFKPLFPKLESYLDIAWKKYQIFSKPAEVFLAFLQKKLQTKHS